MESIQNRDDHLIIKSKDHKSTHQGSDNNSIHQKNASGFSSAKYSSSRDNPNKDEQQIDESDLSAVEIDTAAIVEQMNLLIQKSEAKYDEQIKALSEFTHNSIDEINANFEKKFDKLVKDINEKLFVMDSAIQRKPKGEEKILYQPILESMQALDQDMQNMAKMVGALVEDADICIRMSLQDEKDKQSIALMGTRESKVASIDKNCLSCSQKPSMIVNAFKMACLAYQPTDVEVDGKLMARQALNERRKDELKCKWEECRKLPPWNENFEEAIEQVRHAPSIIKRSICRIRESMKMDSKVDVSSSLSYTNKRNDTLRKTGFTEFYDTGYKRKSKNRNLTRSIKYDY